VIVTQGAPAPTATPTPTPTASAPPTPTATPAASATATATPTPAVSNTRIKDITLEGGGLTNPASGADRVVGTVTLETSQPLKGSYAAFIANAGSSYLQEDFSAADNLFASFYLRLNALPSANVRIALISNAGTTVGNLYLRTSGALSLRNGSSTIGAASAPLSGGGIYRVGLRQRRGTGANAVLEAYLAAGDTLFGAPFAALTNGTWTTPADRLRVGATISVALNAIVDDIRLDSGALP